METIDDEVTGHCLKFMEKAHADKKPFFICWDWLIDHAFMLIPAQALVGRQIESFKVFPPRQKPATFNLDQVMAKMTEGGVASH